jgi:hypothetical protein
LDVTIIFNVALSAAKSSEASTTVRDGAGKVAEACATVTVRVTLPAVSVTVVARVLPVLLAAAVTLTELSFVPDGGETVSHAAELPAVQPALEVTAMLAEPPVAANSSEADETVSHVAELSAVQPAPDETVMFCKLPADVRESETGDTVSQSVPVSYTNVPKFPQTGAAS